MIVTAGRVLRLAAVFTLACGGERVSPYPRPDAGTRLLNDSGVEVDAGLDAGVPPDASPSADGGESVDGGGCAGNQDFTITRAEMPFLVGATIIYLVNRDGGVVEGVDTAGQVTDAGRVWDFSAERAEDHRLIDEILPPSGQWWSALYPQATFAAWLDRSAGLLGVYRVSNTAVELLATVSSEGYRTNLSMDLPVTVFRFPLTRGMTWTETVTGSGTFNYLPFQNVTTYVVSIDAQGEVQTPVGRFPSLRMRTDLDQSIPFTFLRRTQRVYTFLSECWGVVARIASTDNEAAVEFTRAVEYRRVSL